MVTLNGNRRANVVVLLSHLVLTSFLVLSHSLSLTLSFSLSLSPGETASSVYRITDQHYLMKDVMGGNYHVPMDLTFKSVLESGCGAGDWTLVSAQFFRWDRVYINAHAL